MTATGFNPLPSDEPHHVYYPSGNLRELSYHRNGVPANGWSKKFFFENGDMQQAQSFSHSLLIEQIDYDESGNVCAHKIYSHSKKQLIDKPVSAPLPRPNVVDGCNHMGFYYHHLPAIAEFIGAEYHEESLSEAYEAFMKDASDEDNFDPDKAYAWRLVGSKMSFTIQFEKYESLYFWFLHARTEEQYEAASVFMQDLH